MPSIPLNVGSMMHPMQWQRLLKAVDFYTSHRYPWIDAPWMVSAEAIAITKPPEIPMEDVPCISQRTWFGPDTCTINRRYAVGSAEQSYLQNQLDYVAKMGENYRDTGRYVTLTPCFRSEPKVDELHLNYFAKVEIIDFGGLYHNNLHELVSLAVEFFSEYLTVDVIDNLEPHAGEKAFDIVSRRGRIELGSYGVREADKVGKWLYGTGCAEPRLTQAIFKENHLGGTTNLGRET